MALALPQASILARVMRSALIDTLGEDFIRTARAKGLTRGQALRRHALRNALIPVLTILGLQFSFLLAGAIIIEQVFFLPGLGRLIFQAISQPRPDRGGDRGDAAGLRGDRGQLPGRPRLCAGRSAAARDERRDMTRRLAAVRCAACALVGAALTVLFVGAALLSLVWTPYDVTELDDRRQAAAAVGQRIGSAPTISAATCCR